MGVITHFPAVADFFLDLPNATLLHLQVSQTENVMNFQFKLRPGKQHIENYGLELATSLGFPAIVLETATEISTRLSQLHRERLENNPNVLAKKQRDYKAKVVAELVGMMRNSTLGKEAMVNLLQSVQNDVKSLLVGNPINREE